MGLYLEFLDFSKDNVGPISVFADTSSEHHGELLLLLSGKMSWKRTVIFLDCGHR